MSQNLESDQYLTLGKTSEGLYKEKGSKFIAYALPCYTEEEIKNGLANIRKEHHQARHVCYAYRLGLDKKVFRANDDGEPNNSAGTPILGQIQSFELTNVLVAVVRYFGGVKLGVGGLVTAYKQAAKEAIEENEIIIRQVHVFSNINFQYDAVPSVMKITKLYQVKVTKQIFELDCNMEVHYPLSIQEKIEQELLEIEHLKLTNTHTA